MNEVTWWLLIAAIFVVAATVELVLRFARGVSVLRSLKDWLVKVIDALSGGL